MSFCVVPVSPVTRQERILKRPRTTSTTIDDASSIERILKACKQTNQASPHSPCVSHNNESGAATVSNKNHTTRPNMNVPPTTEADNMASFLQMCSNIRQAITFLQNSRRHALGLCLKNQWERALMVLEKVERANDMISRQRRKTVVQEANAQHILDLLADDENINDQQSEQSAKRKVRFSDDVQVAEVEAMDRSPAPMPPFVREEILVLRASRPIPVGNFSEFWN